MKILLVGMFYHGYAHAIADELRLAGHSVTLHDVQPRDLRMKILRRVAPAAWRRALDQHHRHTLAAARGGGSYDLVLFLQIVEMTLETLEAFRAAFPAARFVLYNWDSIATIDYRPLLPQFDTAFTFDPDDARALGIGYLPLFASRAFQNLPPPDEPRAVYFVGNIVTVPRYDAVAAFRDYSERHRIAFRVHAACTLFVRQRLRRAGRKPTGLTGRPIAPDAFRAMIAASAAAFDYANHAQSGYTMRVFETLCARRKIITNNARIRQEPFYSPDRVHVFEGLDFAGVDAFLGVPLAEPAADFPEYRIQAFVGHLLAGTGHPLPESHA